MSIIEKKQPEIKEIVNNLLEGDIYDKREAVKKLGEIGDIRVIEPLIQVLKTEEDFWIRWRAVEVLGKLKAEQALSQLLKLLHNDPHEIVRTYAAWAIGKIEDEKALDELQRALEREKSIKVITEIKKAMNILQRKTKKQTE